MKKLLTLVTALTLVLAVAGCGKDDEVSADALLVTEATTALLLTDLNEVTDNLILPDSGLHSSVITWSSSNTAVLADDGTVTRPAVGEENAVITLTATITIGDESDTKEFTVRVIAAVPTSDVTIAVFNSSAVSIDADIVVTGVIFGVVEGAGVQIWDGTGFVYVYNNGSVDAVIGDTIEVTGQKIVYYGLPEVANVTSIEVLSSGDTLPVYEVTSIIDLFDEDPFDTIYWSKPITITGMVSIDGGNVVITETDGEGTAFDIVVYYKSFPAQITALEALEGQVATVDVIVYGYHDGLGAWRVIVAENAVLTAVVATDAEILASEVGQLDLGDLTEVLDNLTLTTVGVNAGTTISWASDNEAVISTTGVVNRVVGSDTTVVLTATVTVGEETTTKVFTATVKDADYEVATITVTEAVALADDAELVVEGMVSGFNGSDNFVIQDADGTAIIVYSPGFAGDNGLELGDIVIIRGSRDTYYGLNEVVSPVLISIVSTGNTVTVFTDVTVATFTADMDGYQGFNVVLTGLIVVELNDGFGYATVKDASDNEIVFKVSAVPYAETLWAVDDVVDLSVIVYDVYFGNNRVVVYEYTALTETEIIEFASIYIEVPANAITDITLPLLDDVYGVAITWVSDTPAVISNTGVVVQPLEGEGDATVTLTATYTYNSETPIVVVYTVTVAAVTAAVPDLFFSEIIEGSSYNKAIEIYNPTASTVDLSLYTIIENHGGYVNTTVLSGTLAPGEVFVICNPQADGTNIVNNCDYNLGDVPNFNGDDSLQLVIGGVVIDQFIAEADAGTDTAAKDIYAEHTFVRNPDVFIGVTVFDMTEWTVYDQDDFSHIGSHTVTP